MFKTHNKIRKKSIGGRYEVGDDGVVYSGGMPLEAIDGVGVNLHGERVKVCYLVARAFLPNGECRKWVRHKNGDVRDNRASNLEWSDERDEMRRGRKRGVRWVRAWTVKGDVVGVWRNVAEASEATGVKERTIRDALRGKQRTGGGLLWKDA